MSERDRYEPGVPCWVDTLQDDPRAATAFYGDVLGWECVGPGPMPGGGEYYVARIAGRDVAGIGSTPSEGGPPRPVWNTHVAVTDADEAAAAAVRAGGTVLAGPFDAPPAGRIAVLADPTGAAFCAWQADQRHGAQRVNEAGAWSMSILSTPAVARAKQFYEAAFGWQAEPFGDGGVELFRLPGYVGGEPQQPVPRDVVAAVQPSNGGAPPAWNVNFWVSSADRAAETAAAGGGSVVVPPHETPGFRNAVLADPAGAVFAVSQLIVAH